MKKLIAACVILCLVISLCACFAGSRSGMNESINCYYLRKTFEYGAEDSVIAIEQRDASGHMQDYRYLLSMYLQGPLDQNLVSPFPFRTKLISVEKNENQLEISLNKELTNLDNASQVLAFACLAKTGIAISNAESVHITVESDEFSSIDVTISADQLLLYDPPIPELSEE